MLLLLKQLSELLLREDDCVGHLYQIAGSECGTSRKDLSSSALQSLPSAVFEQETLSCLVLVKSALFQAALKV